jgi:hypothetical protein
LSQKADSATDACSRHALSIDKEEEMSITHHHHSGSRRGQRLGSLLACMGALLPLAHAQEPKSSTPLEVASVPDEPVRTRPPSFEYAQCANSCQAERDLTLTLCLTPDNPNKPKGPMPGNCDDRGRKAYQACLATCPVDVGADNEP